MPPGSFGKKLAKCKNDTPAPTTTSSKRRESVGWMMPPNQK